MSTANEASYYECLNHRLAAMVPADAQRVLDVGCGAGVLGVHLERAVPGRRVWGIEIIPEAAERAAERLERVVEGNVETLDPLPFEPGSFDCIIFGDVLEHLVEPAAVLERMRPLLAPGGAFVCCIPNVAHWSVVTQLLAGEFTYTDSGLLDRTHLRFFTAKTFRALLEQAGFAVEAEEPLLFPRPDLAEPLSAAAAGFGVNPTVAQQALATYQIVFRARPRDERVPRAVPAVQPVHAGTSAVVLCSGGPQVRQTVDAVAEAGPGEIVLVVTGGAPPRLTGIPVKVVELPGAAFAAAAAAGIAASAGEHVALVDHDVVPAAGWLDRLSACLRTAPGGAVGAVAPTSDRVDGPQLVDAYLPPAMWGGATPDAVGASLAQHHPGESVPARVLEPGCVLLRRDAYDQAGGFDPALEHGFEALDLWWRMRVAGWHLRVAVDAFTHRRSEGVVTGAERVRDQSGADAVATKLLAHYGRGAVPPAAELWGVDWFRPTLDPWASATTFAIVPLWPDHGTLPAVLGAYVAAFGPADPVSLVIGVPTPGPVAPDQALEVVAAVLQELGCDLDAVPDIAITPLAGGDRSALDPSLVWVDERPSVEDLRAAVAPAVA